MRETLPASFRGRLTLVCSLLSLLQVVDVRAQSQLVAPSGQGARAVRGLFIAPPGAPAVSYVAGHALLLRDPGGVVEELSKLCASARTVGDSARPAIVRRVGALAVQRTRADMRRIEFGLVPPGQYVALASIELQWPRIWPRDSARVRRFFSVMTVPVSAGVDTVKIPFVVGRPAFKSWDAHAKALSCLEFLVIPAPAERVVTPMPVTTRRGSGPT